MLPSYWVKEQVGSKISGGRREPNIGEGGRSFGRHTTEGQREGHWEDGGIREKIPGSTDVTRLGLVDPTRDVEVQEFKHIDGVRV